MGFRHPVDSFADEVQTSTDPTVPGVRVYESGTGVTRRGVVEFSDGFTADGVASIARHAEANVRSGNSSQSGGLTLTGGSYVDGTVAAPVLELGVTTSGPGIYSSAASLTGAPLTVDRPITSTGAGEQWQALPFGPAWVAWDTTANAPAYRRDAAGECHVRGMVKLNGQTIGAGSTLAIANMPAGFYLPGVRAWRSAVVLNASGFFVAVVPAWIETTGALTVYNTTAAAFTAGFGVSLGLSYPTT